jgi:hypothetical protein
MVKDFRPPSQKVTIVSEKTIDALSVAIRGDGLAQVKIQGNVEIDVSHVKQIVSLLEELGQKRKYPLLIVSGEFTLPTPEARAYIATPESDPYASAEAYAIKSFSQRLVGNVYLSFNKPARPTRLFTDENKAVEWLKTFLLNR